MAEKLKLELVTPYKKVLTEEVDEITAVGTLGEFGVLPGHAPFLTSLKVGELSYKADNKVFHLAVNWGYFEVENDTGDGTRGNRGDGPTRSISNALGRLLGRAEEKLTKLNPEDHDFRIYEAALERAVIRVQVASKTVRK